ncbi:MAG: DNA repair protein RecN [Gammaproteobacteria bacterium]|jgi:DNA repair protein RecN (Recombination protein N)|nr:DNA repair protein RecN [Gammaproteobacteria bacterium]MBT4146033.1 DNA repair protein RecN [Gammaproteobacteria bacterium]MBT5223542.1 DNA repair protein RecN [Gammaproteobacteria bacterium]MBT5967090.1 DNA repair protein RecN [Gammaproteobacteria bacterium]MBT6419777.1 DNA repair protein RecN [Gammaproteobacteria bacterium]
MLQNLNIIDLAIVESLDLNLEKGLSVLTGETGAGKSILLTALGLALGGRADASYVRPDCDRAEINLSFDLSDAPAAHTWLQDNELDDDDQCLVRRTIRQDGKSKAYINGRPTTLQLLKQLSSQLVEIHGQHAHLTLLDSEEQRNFLDNFAQNTDLLTQTNQAYSQWRSHFHELQTLTLASTEQSNQQDLFSYQLNELEQLDLVNYDYPALSAEHTKLANLEQILSIGQTQLDALTENEQQSANQIVNQSISALSELSSLTKELEEPTQLLLEAQIQIQEASHQLRYFLEAQELDPQGLLELDKQISIIQNLSRKHQVDPEELPEVAKKLAAQLDNLNHSSERIEELNLLVAKSHQDYFALAKAVSDKRSQAAIKLSALISDMIQELGMPQGEFSIAVSPQEIDQPKINGTDKIEFLVSANKGLPLRPLAKVASGGELSRISLAIQVTTSHDKDAPTMIFDEVDSGIGGGIAEIVGQKLRTLGKCAQVLCVTHLPQVASQAHQHLFVFKTSDAEMTTSQVRTLSTEQRIEETARMLGGVNITESTLTHAKEMLLAGIAGN